MGAFALAAGLLVSAIGVLRMRAWGVLLGGVMAISVVGAAFFVEGAWSGFAWAAVPRNDVRVSGSRIEVPSRAPACGSRGSPRASSRMMEQCRAWRACRGLSPTRVRRALRLAPIRVVALFETREF